LVSEFVNYDGLRLGIGIVPNYLSSMQRSYQNKKQVTPSMITNAPHSKLHHAQKQKSSIIKGGMGGKVKI